MSPSTSDGDEVRPCDDRCDCDGGVERREFLRTTSLSILGGAIASLDTVAGPFAEDAARHLVPADKKLSVDWLRALTSRGEPTVLRGEELRFVGMPVGGIACGQLYLGGDGRLWHWDIFRSRYSSDYASGSKGPHYASPLVPDAVVAQGFAIRSSEGGAPRVRALSSTGFSRVEFEGRYPIGTVRYEDPACDVAVELEAFSPFVPLDAESSALPVTLMRFTLRNKTDATVEAEIGGWLENAVCRYDDQEWRGERRNRVRRAAGVTSLECTARPVERPASKSRPDVLFEDFEGDTYEKWTATGTAFGSGPIASSSMPAYQGDVGAGGKHLVNSHNTRQGEDVSEGDAHTGTLTSDAFRIERRYISLLVGGGAHENRTCVRLIVDGKTVRTVHGRNHNRLHPHVLDVSELTGKTARLQIVDEVSGGWGNIGVDEIVFTDKPTSQRGLETLHGYGTMALALLGDPSSTYAAPTLGTAVETDDVSTRVFDRLHESSKTEARRPFGSALIGALGRKVTLAAGGSRSLTFLVAWNFPFYREASGEMAAIPELAKKRRHYAKRFATAADVVDHVVENHDALAGPTRTWVDTWYDSTLPHWFLDRTFVTLDTLATQTCHWFDDGRFWAWEGVDCCPGTCQHVWNYAQGLSRIFPAIERDLRERVDFGLAFHEDGRIDYRGDSSRGHYAFDGQAGTILRVYREHRMSVDDAFLRRLWPRVRKSLEFLMARDGDGDGLIEGRQYNTLDSGWYGPMAWISSFYLAAVSAGSAMAREVGDAGFSERCESVLKKGRKSLVDRLFNGEYFIHEPDPAHPEAPNTGDGCHIDQLFGQSYASLLGLDRVVPERESISALRALWKYNYAPDVGVYRDGIRKTIAGGRWYALAGDGGLLMCTWPRGGAELAPGKGNPDWMVGYFNECMTGFEYQVAAHMIREGTPDLVEKGLALTRTVHDRYTPSRRNPFNEVECSDHYSRAMASYGVFLAACGFEHHGPRGVIGFAPRIHPERFRAAFTAAEGWGTYTQRREGDRQSAEIGVRFGRLRVRTVRLELEKGRSAQSCVVTVDGKPRSQRFRQEAGKLEVTLSADAVISRGGRLEVAVRLSRQS